MREKEKICGNQPAKAFSFVFIGICIVNSYLEDISDNTLGCLYIPEIHTNILHT